ncbi:MAG: GTP 3',8-cyclase MoaA [Rhodospirillales bacterium]
MIDPYGREITYLRVSVTDRCDLRCTYCMSEDMEFLPRSDILSLEEIDRVCSAFIGLGVRKLRITGGEPLIRRNIESLFKSLGRHIKSGGLDEIALTTNGTQLARHAKSLIESGLKRINVSLDTLNAGKYREVTRGGKIERVLAGLEAARENGIRVKINTVALKGVNDDEMDNLVSWCGDRGFDLTFIETMPMGESGAERVGYYLPLAEVRSSLEKNWTFEDISDSTGGPSRYVRVAETNCRVGFITPMSRHFCDTCNRVRLTSTGLLYMCLGRDASVDLRVPLRASQDDAPLLAAIEAAIALKPKGHDFVIDSESGRPSVSRHMSVTGG